MLDYAAAVADTPWLMLAEIDEGEAYAGIRTLSWTLGSVGVLGLLLLYSAAWQIWRHDRQQRELALLQARQTAEIAERKAAEQELRAASVAAAAASAAKSEFLAHMSHEIRTPMNAVLGLAQVLARAPLSPDQLDMVQRIRGAGQSLMTILNDVLDLSKIEAGQLRIEQRPFDLPALLANLDSLMGRAARAKGLTLRIDAPAPPPPMLLGDGLRVEQVLFNLAGNAIKFTAQGEVAVRVRVVESNTTAVRVRFEVRDTGIGIAADVLPRLFAPFTQGDASIGRRFGGTGLGLSICKRLVELMGGCIGAESEHGIGSQFWCEIPFARAAEGVQALPARVPAPAPGPRLRGAHLLVVDDSAMNRDLVERALGLEGARATLAADGQQAIALLRASPDAFDGVLMDVQMPVLDGLSATRMIRAELGLTTLPVIAFTAGVLDEQRAQALAAGADDVLAKPMDLEEMAQLLARWVRLRPPPDQLAPAHGAAEAGGSAAAAPEAGLTAKPPQFPFLSGVDRERAMQRLGGDASMFLSLLQMFVEDNADAVALARIELARGDSDAAARRFHTLRSNAGFLCALELMTAAGELEQAINRSGADIDARLNAIEQQIAALVTAATQFNCHDDAA